VASALTILASSGAPPRLLRLDARLADEALADGDTIVLSRGSWG
jgi:hypothetical protein